MKMMEWLGQLVVMIVLVGGAFLFGVVIGDVKQEISDMNEDKR